MNTPQHTQQARKLSKKKIILISLAFVLAVLLSVVAYASLRPATDAQRSAYPFNKVEDLNSAVTYVVMNGALLEKKNTSNDKTDVLYEDSDLADFTQLPDGQIIVLTYGGMLWKVSEDGDEKELITTIPGSAFASLQTVGANRVGLLVDMPEDAIVETESEFEEEEEHTGHDEIGFTQTLKFVNTNTGDMDELTSADGHPYGVTEWLMDVDAAHFVFRVGEGNDIGLMDLDNNLTNLGSFTNMGGFFEEDGKTWFWGRGDDTSVSADMVNVDNVKDTRTISSLTQGRVSDVITSIASTADGVEAQAVSVFATTSEPGFNLISHQGKTFEMNALTQVDAVADIVFSNDDRVLLAQMNIDQSPTVVFLNADSMKPGHDPVRGEKVVVVP